MSTPDEEATHAANDAALAAAEACANKWRARGDEPVIGEAVHAEHTLEAVAIARRALRDNRELRETLERVTRERDEAAEERDVMLREALNPSPPKSLVKGHFA